MMKESFREIAKFLNPIRPVSTLEALWNEHRHIDGMKEISFGKLVDRHCNPKSKTAKFLCYNTWLLHAPFGNSKPVIPYRAYLIGKEVNRSKYDIAALTEVFEKEDASLIKKNSKLRWSKEGHDGSLTEKGGGLYTLSNFKITGSDKHEFKIDGGVQIADSWSEKGVLLTEIDLGIGKIDLYVTHLIYGTTFPDDNAISEKRRTSLRIEQVKELKSFISKTHKPENIAIVTGDFNIDANAQIEDFDAYDKMMRLLSKLKLKNGRVVNLEDMWVDKGGRTGATDNSYTKCKKRYGGGTIFCDDSGSLENGRIDYVLIERPRKEHNFTLDTTVVRRRPFPLPTLNLMEIARILTECGFTKELQLEILKHSIKFRPIGLSPHPIVLSFNEIRALLTMLQEEFDFEKFFNSWLKKKCRQHKDDPFGHLSDHIGLDFTFIASN